MKISVIDVGGTFIKYACMNEQSEILSRGKIPTPMSSREEFVDTIVDIFKSMPDSEGIAISLPGIIDVDKGYCITSGALKYNDNFAIVEALQNKVNVKVTIENDANCAAIAEMTMGSLSDVDDGFVMVFGTGIGSSFFKNRKIYRGHHFSAGEISFVIIDRDGSIVDSDIFGNQCSALGLCKMYAETKNLSIEEVDGIKVFEAIHSNDKIAIECLNKITRRVAVQIINFQTILDPQRFAIGGGISAQKIFIDYIRKHLDEIYKNSEFKIPHAEVVACKFLNDANLMGALQFWLVKTLHN